MAALASLVVHAYQRTAHDSKPVNPAFWISNDSLKLRFLLPKFDIFHLKLKLLDPKQIEKSTRPHSIGCRDF
jgi:hypothetical protein